MPPPLTTSHIIHHKDASRMDEVDDESINLIVTSPPYPMVAMWDEMFGKANRDISKHLENGEGRKAHTLMHQQLHPVWKECARVLTSGGIMCINIGDATRSIIGEFALYDNRTPIVTTLLNEGLTMLPSVIWRKPSNAPNKFMGSGMLPTSAYVTHEHEYILIFRKGQRRIFKSADEKRRRRESAYFWEERNQWFSDQWKFTGSRQSINSTASRPRSAAFPIELPYRLINMYSVIGDTVLDTFLGTGTTSKAAIVSGRNSIGYEIDSNLTTSCFDPNSLLNLSGELLHQRFENHLSFIESRQIQKGKRSIKHWHEGYGLPVMTKQETGIYFYQLETIKECNGAFRAQYS